MDKAVESHGFDEVAVNIKDGEDPPCPSACETKQDSGLQLSASFMQKVTKDSCPSQFYWKVSLFSDLG